MKTDHTKIYYQDFLEDGDGVPKLRKFLQQVIKNFSEEIFRFYDIWEYLPFDGEKRISSILIPAIYNYTKNILLEDSFQKKEDHKRRIDLMTTDGKNNYLIEFKHEWQNKSVPKGKWNDVIKQIDDISQKRLDWIEYKGYNTFKIAFLIMPTYLDSNKDKEHPILDMSAKEYCQEIYEKFEEGNKPNVISVIKINDAIEWASKEHNEIHPFITFALKVEEVE